ncbi:MAG: hypothetical protein ACC657_17690 [Thiohalomonadales bacterium]
MNINAHRISAVLLNSISRFKKKHNGIEIGGRTSDGSSRRKVN